MRFLLLFALLLTACGPVAQGSPRATIGPATPRPTVPAQPYPEPKAPTPLEVTVYTTLTTPPGLMDVTVNAREAGTVQVVPWGERTGGTMVCGVGECQGPGTVTLRVSRGAGVVTAEQGGVVVSVAVDVPPPPTATPPPVVPRAVLLPVLRGAVP